MILNLELKSEGKQSNPMLGSYQSSRKAGKYILAQLLLLGRLFPTGGGAVVLKRLKITKDMHYQEESGHLEQL